jgi:hypothetical protein
MSCQLSVNRMGAVARQQTTDNRQQTTDNRQQKMEPRTKNQDWVVLI